MIVKRVVLAIGAIVLSCHCALAACETKDVIFADAFKDAMGGWTQGAGINIDGGIATLSVRKGFGSKVVLNNGFLMRDGHICVVATYPTLEQAQRATAPTTGIVFGAKDTSNYYAFEVTAVGAYALVRSNNNNLINVIDWTTTSAVKKSFGVENQIEVTIDKGVVTLFINRQKINSSRIQLPDGDSQFGLFAATDILPDTDVPFQFRNFVVSRPAP